MHWVVSYIIDNVDRLEGDILVYKNGHRVNLNEISIFGDKFRPDLEKALRSRKKHKLVECMLLVVFFLFVAFCIILPLWFYFYEQ